MKMFKIKDIMKTKYIAILSIALLSLAACDDFLDTEYQGGSQSGSQIEETVGAVPERVKAAVSGMYTILSEPFGYFGISSERADDGGYPAICLNNDLNSGDMTNIVSGYDWFTPAHEFTDRTPDYANPRLRSGLLYNCIYAANAVLASIPAETTNEELLASRGQARAVRAFCYLNLVPYFQFKYAGNEDKPTVIIQATDGDGRDPLNNPRVSHKEMYEYILNDLNGAIADLDGFDRANKGQIDQQVAYGLRARAYLNMEKWAEALADATEAVDGYTPYAISELKAPGFNNAEDHNWMWALLIPASTASNYLCTWPSQLGSFSGHGYTGTGIYRCINSLLYKKISNTDVRRFWWLDADKKSDYLNGQKWTDAKGTVLAEGQEIVDLVVDGWKEPFIAYTNVKFGQKSGIGSGYNDGDWCLMRAEEMILIQAEATAMTGDVDGAKTILENFVKTYRDPSYTILASDANNIVNEVWLQRRIELWGEGFAMADKMRLGKNIVRYHPGEATNVPEAYQFNLAANDPWLLMRFTQRELDNNAGCVQNEGGKEPKTGDGASITDGVTD